MINSMQNEDLFIQYIKHILNIHSTPGSVLGAGYRMSA